MKKALAKGLRKMHNIELTRINEQIKCVGCIDPEFILWQNFCLIGNQKKFRKLMSITVLILIVTFTFLLVQFLSDIRFELYKKYNNDVCNEKVDYIKLFEDQTSTDSKSHFIEIEQCYCSQKYNKDTFEFLKSNMQKECYNWFKTYSQIKFLQFAVPLTITIINILAEIIFAYLSKAEREPNIGLEKILEFKYIFVQSTINTGIILVFFKKNTSNKNLFLTIGPQLCMTLVCEIFSHKSIKIFEILLLHVN